MVDDEFGLLIVCHANQCRSPMAERLARHAFAEHLGSGAGRLIVSSAGTHARPGLPMHPLAQQTLTESGVDVQGFSSRVVTADLLNAAQLILTADRTQRSWCATLAPSALRRTFTVRQLGRLASVVDGRRLVGASPESRMAELINQVTFARGRLPSPSPADDNLDDPVNHPLAAFRSCAAQIQQVVEVIIHLVRPD